MKYQLAKHISLTQVDDEAVLLDLDAGTYFGLNAVGATFLCLMEARASFDEAVANIQSDFDAPRAEIRQDLTELLATLLEQKLIQLRKPIT